MGIGNIMSGLHCRLYVIVGNVPHWAALFMSYITWPILFTSSIRTHILPWTMSLQILFNQTPPKSNPAGAMFFLGKFFESKKWDFPFPCPCIYKKPLFYMSLHLWQSSSQFTCSLNDILHWLFHGFWTDIRSDIQSKDSTDTKKIDPKLTWLPHLPNLVYLSFFFA